MKKKGFKGYYKNRIEDEATAKRRRATVLDIPWGKHVRIELGGPQITAPRRHHRELLVEALKKLIVYGAPRSTFVVPLHILMYIVWWW